MLSNRKLRSQYADQLEIKGGIQLATYRNKQTSGRKKFLLHCTHLMQIKTMHAYVRVCMRAILKPAEEDQEFRLKTNNKSTGREAHGSPIISRADQQITPPNYAL
jgi:hypothetical protein